MNIHIVTGRRDMPKEGRFIVGVFSSSEEANLAMEEAKEKMGNQFSFFTETRVLNQHIRYHGYEKEGDNDDISLEERVDALEQYMNVAQMKIMALQSNLDFMLYLHKEEIGDTEAKRRMNQVSSNFGRNK